MSASDIEHNMTYREFAEWYAYFKIRRKLEKKAQKDAQTEAKAKQGSSGGRRPRRR